MSYPIALLACFASRRYRAQLNDDDDDGRAFHRDNQLQLLIIPSGFHVQNARFQLDLYTYTRLYKTAERKCKGLMQLSLTSLYNDDVQAQHVVLPGFGMRRQIF